MAANTYSEEFKRSSVKKLLHPNSGGLRVTVSKLDLPPSTLFCWRKKYANFTSIKKSNRSKDWTPEQKLDAVLKSYLMAEKI
jgi:transposase-like protein